jgi:hypothetical protein
LTDESENGGQPRPHYEGGIPILPGRAERDESARHAKEEVENKYKISQERIQRGILVTQIALVVFGLIGNGVSFYQAKTARDSAMEAKRAADLAADSFESAYGENGIADRTMSQTITQTAQQVRAANASENAVKTTQNEMRLDQRPWVGITPIRTAPVAVGIPLASDNAGNVSADFKALVINSGKTPSQQVVAIVGMSMHSGEYVPTLDDAAWMTRMIDLRRTNKFRAIPGFQEMSIPGVAHSDIFILFPVLSAAEGIVPDRKLFPPDGERMGVHIPNSYNLGTLPTNIPRDLPLPTNWFISRDAIAILYGEITYRDSFAPSGQHLTRFCIYRTRSPEYPYLACPVFNEMN